MDVIVIGGAAGTGKTTTATELHKRLGCPRFEFGWIGEFRKLNPHTEATQRQEEQLSFENLVMVCKNYIRHGNENVVITDIDDVRLLEIAEALDGYEYVIINLYSDDDGVIKERVLARDNENAYRDWETAIRVNQMVKRRRPLSNEYRIRTDDKPVEEVADEVMDVVARHRKSAGSRSDSLSRADYYSYISD